MTKLLVDVGAACVEYQDAALRNLPCKRIQCDEIWSFVYAKQKNVPAERKGEFGIGDVWTWTAIDADTKLVPSWLVGDRDADAAMRVHERSGRPPRPPRPAHHGRPQARTWRPSRTRSAPTSTTPCS